MKVFITGGTGFVGSAVVQELVANGFEVVGLARSETSAQKLISWGAQPVRGSLTSLSTLATAAAQADAIIHLGFNNDFRHFFRLVQWIGGPLKLWGVPLVGLISRWSLRMGRRALESMSRRSMKSRILGYSNGSHRENLRSSHVS